MGLRLDAARMEAVLQRNAVLILRREGEMEHRHHPRMHAARRALLYHPKGFICPCRIDNISTNGLFVRAGETRLHKGSCVKLAINVSPRSAKLITIKALVVHKKGDGMGLLLERGIPFEELFEGLAITFGFTSPYKDIQ